MYHVTMSNGKSYAIDAQNAADAIGMALDQFRGMTVKDCFLGGSSGVVNFDVPPHKALPARTEYNKPAEETMDLFGSVS